MNKISYLVFIYTILSLQELHESYENITHLKKKVKSVIDTLKKSKKLTPDIEKGVLNARNLSELDLIVSFVLFFV